MYAEKQEGKPLVARPPSAPSLDQSELPKTHQTAKLQHSMYCDLLPRGEATPCPSGLLVKVSHSVYTAYCLSIFHENRRVGV